MTYLALINKTFDDTWKNLENMNKVVGLSTQEVVDKYQGLEGDAISVFKVTDDNSSLKKNIDLLLAIDDQKKTRILFIAESGNIPELIKELFDFVGYDYGVFEEEMNSVYSSVFNEILFGNVKELIFLKNKLNESFLFSSRQEAENYLNLHHELLKEGKNVEHEEYMKIFQIWRLNPHRA
ncbi:MAG: hypothetical protein ACH350_10370 [Parachlamydiaceae bacterium]